MDLMLKGKVAIVGGASKGLGRACAQALAEEGVNVTMCSRSQPDLEKAAQEIRDATGIDVLAFAGDLEQARDHPRARRRHGRALRAPRHPRQQLRRPAARVRARRHRRAVGDRRAALAAVLRAHVARSPAASEEEPAAGASSTSSRAPSTSRSPTSRSPAPRAWASWRTRRASPTKWAATASW